MKKVFPVFLVFLAMGFGDVVGPMVSLAKETFTLSNFMAQLLPFSGFLMFGLLSVPMGVLQDRKGKKYLLLLGLAIALIGLLTPMFAGMYGPKPQITPGDSMKFYVLLASIFLLGAGATTLQVVGNPIMRDVSPEGAYSSNLSLAQAIKAIGSSLGFLLPPFAVAVLGLDWPVLFPIYSAIIVITLLCCAPMQVNEAKDPNAHPVTLGSCLSLLFQDGFILMMVMGIFLYVGAEVCFSSGVPLLLKEKFGITGFGLWVSWALFFLPILLGRFAGAMVLKRISPRKFLVATVLLSVAGILCVFTGMRALTFAGIILTGLGFANIFPLIFSITVDAKPEKTNAISGLMVTAIVGGAIVPPLMGLMADLTGSIQIGFVVPLAAPCYIAWAALANLKRSAPTA
ncbi:MAG: MFS transporter [Elusimicrobiota bacterium]